MKYSRGACQQCGGHLEFPTESAGQKVQCPHCSWETELVASDSAPDAPAKKRTDRKHLVAIGAALGMAAAFGAIRWWQSAKAKPVPPPVAVVTPRRSANAAPGVPPPDPWHGLKPSPIKLEKSGDGNLVYAVGTVENTSGRQRFGVKVELDVFDSKGEKLDPATDYTEVIEPGKDWRFRALIVDRNATRATLKAIDEDK